MAESVQIAWLEGGELKVPEAGGKLREAVLALPLSRLIVKIVRIPGENLEDPVGYATPLLKAMSPYPDEPLTVSCETLRETESGRIVLAAALPEGSADDIATALDGAGLNITRIDALPLGRLVAILPQFVHVGGEIVRRILLVGGLDDIAVFVLDDDLPVAVRAISPGGDMRREVMLSLLEAEEFAGARELKGVVTAGDVLSEGLDLFAPVRALEDAGDAVGGVAERTLDAETLNALPDSWREVLEETRFKRKMKIGFGVAGAIWVLAMAVLIGVPMIYDYRTGRLNDQKEQKAMYNKVNAKVEQVKAVKAISNHDQGGLETLRAVVSALPPEDVELSRWNFRRNDRLTFSGTAASGDQAAILMFKDKLDALMLSQISGLEEDGETPFFSDVTLPKGINTRSGRAATFDVECSFRQPEEDE